MAIFNSYVCLLKSAGNRKQGGTPRKYREIITDNLLDAMIELSIWATPIRSTETYT